MAAVLVTDMTIGTDDIWIFDLERNLRSRFTFDPALDVFPVWSPDSRGLYFASNRGGEQGIYRKDIAGAGNVELILRNDRNLWPSSVSPDEKWLLLSVPGEGTGQDISVVALEGAAEMQPFRHTEFQEASAVFSPDGRWVAYHSDESGEFEIYVTPFPGPGRRWQVSTASGAYPVWSGDGSQVIFTRMDGVLMSARVRAQGETFEVEGEDELFIMRPPEVGGSYFSISGDAERVLIIPGDCPAGGFAAPPAGELADCARGAAIKGAIMDQKYIDLFDEFTHGKMNRRDFMERLAKLAGGAAAAATLVPILQNNYAEAGIVSEDDERLVSETATYDVDDVTMSGYLARPKGGGKRPGSHRHPRKPRSQPAHQGRRATDGPRRLPGLWPDALSPVGGLPLTRTGRANDLRARW